MLPSEIIAASVSLILSSFPTIDFEIFFIILFNILIKLRKILVYFQTRNKLNFQVLYTVQREFV